MLLLLMNQFHIIHRLSSPVIWSMAVEQANVSILYNYDVNATDPDNDALEFRLFKYPEGMTIDSKTGHIS